MSLERSQTHSKERPPGTYGGSAVWEGGLGHHLWPTVKQPQGGGRPVPAQHCEDAGVHQQQANGQRPR